MANRARLSVAKPKIEAMFEASKKRVYSPGQIEKILSLKESEWRLPMSITSGKFIDYLIEKSKLEKISLEFPRPITRYIWGTETSETAFELALSLNQTAYLSHYTAMFFHDLTEQIPKHIYVSVEQPPKRVGSELTQTGIDNAFSKPARRSNNNATYHNFSITLLNGQSTNNLGVIKYADEASGLDYKITDIERTLIDAAVRPFYSGGVFEVLKAFEFAKEKNKISVNTLNAYLKKINFIYPYHQVIGFYLERAGYPDNRLKLFEKEEMKFDFYLTNEIINKSYSERWKLYYPSSMD